MIGINFSGFASNVSSHAIVADWTTPDSTALLTYRFRPRFPVRQAILNGERATDSLTLDDYNHERVAGGVNEAGEPIDLLATSWDTEFGARVNDADLQNFLFVELPALRDAARDLRQQTTSPLARLISALKVSDEQREQILKAVRDANNIVKTSQLFTDLETAIDASYRLLAGQSGNLNVSLGLADPTLSGILKALSVLLSDVNLKNYDMQRNGLGFNNLLYAAIQIEYFRQRLNEGSAGQLLAIEELEAHLHPQAQENLVRSLAAEKFQSIVSTHSSQVTNVLGISAFICLDHSDNGSSGSRIGKCR